MSRLLLFVVLTLSVIQFPLHAQVKTDSLRFSEKLLIDVPVVDYPFMKYAARMAYNKRIGLEASGMEQPSFGDYLRAYESVSMLQAVAITKDLHATNYYFQNKHWNRWIPPVDRKTRFYNRLAANAASGVVDYLLAYHLMVFGPVWMHEEFHRNGLALRGISSFDETYYRLNGKGIPSGSVSHVLDQDMINFKRDAPEELVRSFASGIEAQYQLLRHMQKDDFFEGTDYANIAMHILITKQSVDYVNQFRIPDYDASIDTMNYYGETMAERDFVGWDFTPWVYDLFRPDEPYEARGVHQHGNGIDRVIKRSDLTPEEDRYLTRMGRLQLINFASPFMVGIKRIRLNDDLTFNMALHHYPTSFGYNLNADVYLNLKGVPWMVALHSYHNKAHAYPGIEVMRPSISLRSGTRSFRLDARAMVWIQPEKSRFYDEKGQPGGLLGARLHHRLGNVLSCYFEVEGKTRGWVAGHPFLKSNLGTRLGLYLDIVRG